jgi:RimJ/RimL family protein N-acetyltransferase
MLHQLSPPSAPAWLTATRCVASQELLRLTGSERLSLEEEIANQRSWTQDDHKVTFIVCALDAAFVEPLEPTHGMCGDVNAFLAPLDLEEGEEDQGQLAAEVEVMIADPLRRRSGCAREAILLLFRWLLRHEPRISLLVAKINDDNEPSLCLFRALGFTFHRHLTFFGQTELHLAAHTALASAESFWEAAGARQLIMAQTGAPADKEQWVAGRRARLVGLNSRPSLNGVEVALLQRLEGSGRWVTRAVATDERLSVKPSNLEPSAVLTNVLSSDELTLALKWLQLDELTAFTQVSLTCRQCARAVACSADWRKKNA